MGWKSGNDYHLPVKNSIRFYIRLPSSFYLVLQQHLVLQYLSAFSIRFIQPRSAFIPPVDTRCRWFTLKNQPIEQEEEEEKKVPPIYTQNAR